MFDALLSLPALYLFTTGASSWSTSLNLLFFYMTWSTLLLSHPPLRVELLGTAMIRLMFFFAPTLLFLAADNAAPSLTKSIKLQGVRSLGGERGLAKAKANANTLLCALGNIALGIGIQAAVEYVLVELLHWKSALKISTTLPMPGELVWDMLRAFIAREIMVYYIHRFVLHEGKNKASKLHNRWQHDVTAPWSGIAHYDHPLPWVLVRFLPCYLPAVALRFNLLTYFLFMALVSIEEVTTYSGYKNVYSMLGGATRRTDLHFEMGGKGNYSPWGIMDWIHGTSAGGDIREDAEEEWDKHQQRKASRRSQRSKGKA